MRVKKYDSRIFSITIFLIAIIIIGAVTIPFLKEQSEKIETVVVYHQWTSTGEQAALNSVINVFLDKYPEITFLPTPVMSRSTSGGGFVLFNVVEQLVFSGHAPDSFQAHAGYETKPYFDAGLLESVDEIWQSSGLDESTPPLIKAMSQFKGKYYSIPINIHRSNVVWYNKELLDKNNIDPSDLTTWDSFFEACEKLKSKGIEYPIQSGTTWTLRFAFDQIIASQGIDFYEDWINGKVTSADERLLNSFEILKKYLSYSNTDYIETSWDEATARIISGEGIFNIMGDWANGEFKAAGEEYGKDYGTFPVPETGDMYGVTIDAFQFPKNVDNPQNAKKWLEIVASNEGQDAFNPLKGSISVRTDQDVTKYDTYQKLSILDFIVIKKMFPDLTNGAPKDFEQKEQEVLAQFAKDLDINKAAQEITSYAEEIKNEYTIEWDLS